jgi:hypothetical protein
VVALDPTQGRGASLNKKSVMIKYKNCRALLMACAILSCNAADAADAEVVMLIGKADTRRIDTGEWQPLKLKQEVPSGASVRTGQASQVALLLKDQTQLRLSERSVFNLRAIGTEQETALDLVAGKVWAQVKNVFRFATVAVQRRNVTMRTQTATIGIRGTDWVVEVGHDAKTTVTLLSG